MNQTMTKVSGLFAALIAAICTAGCAKVNSAGQVQQAMDLVHDRSGTQPQWTQDWDELAPAWKKGDVLQREDAVAMALRNNRELRAEIETIGQAQADLVQAGLLQNPVLTLGAKLPSGGGRALFEGGLVPFQGLRDLWLIPLRKETADAALQASIVRVADQAITLASQVKILYAKIQHSQRSIELTRENLAIVDQIVTLIQSRHAAGRSSQIEVNTERIRRLRLQSDLLAMQSEDRKLKRELLMMMGFAGATDDWSVTSIHELQSELTQTPGDEVLLSLAFRERLDVFAAQWSVWTAGREVTLARGEAWPAFDISIAFERDAAPPSQNPSVAAQAGNAAVNSLLGGEPAAPSFEPFGPKSREVKWMVGPMLDLEIPIFDQNQAQIMKAVHELRRRHALHMALEQRVQQKVREFKVSYDQSAEQVKLFREAIIPDVDANLELIQQAYRTGADVFTNYLGAQEDLISTRLAALAFLRDAVIQQAELEREVGGQLPGSSELPAAGVSLELEPRS